MYKLIKQNKENSEHKTIEGALNRLCLIEDNPHYALAGGGYTIFNDNMEKQEISYELKTKIEKQTRKNQYYNIMDKISLIAKELNLKIEDYNDVENNNGYFSLNNIRTKLYNENISFCISTRYNQKNRLIISLASFPPDKNNNHVHYLEYNEKKPEITFSQDREIKTIVDNIVKKFYPIIEEHKKRYLSNLNEINNYIDNTSITLKYLKGEELTKTEIENRKIYINGVSIKASENEVYFDYLSVDKEKAKKILDILKEEK